ncbi:hypothetical protein QN277_028320 [Acacia crassicarpa]|uniref:WRKY domain-containing protein n=1 Tax=Acacia crassicarpa TaxID=499986 RepID=A0AAE1J2V8_9FABA|nr:hypothetical protein QN277_028320 [Acacia crassicarpa]
MDELAFFMDWDLQAIVRGYTGEHAPSETTTTTIIDVTNPNFPHFCSELQVQDDDPFCITFPEFSDTTLMLDELGDLHKPFSSTQTIITTTSVPIPKEVVIKASDQEVQDLHESPRKRISKKNQNKRVVKQVREDGLCDAWAWRKYGQKPIKGSPYPRSYYRCSSSKGCLARKQVERSHLDPQVFIVTYTAEHSDHDHTPRSSRKTRQYSNIIVPPKATHEHMTSSDNPLEDSVEDEPIIVSGGSGHCLNKDQLSSQVAQIGEIVTGHDNLTNDDWFPSIDELDGLSQEFALDGYLHGQL